MDRRTPHSLPLRTLKDVSTWQPGQDEFCVATVTQAPRSSLDGPKMLVCHDMKGGYMEDRLTQGCGKVDTYRFYNWQFVDTFVYFSHHFVTIPPPSWTNTAHRHGVSVLGTLITEWNDGKKACTAFLESEQSYKAFADKLVQISKYYRFDGWLVNIENIIEPTVMVERLCGFVRYLTEEQHRHVPNSLVIWYDSVVDSGQLDWQNTLNDKNSLFFDACDGIFLNYCWKDDNLADSKSMATEKSRPYDVYVGIDVYGRGCLGGGGFNTCEALEEVRKHDLSAAMFAFSWTYEKLGADDFIDNEDKFWKLLGDLCYTRRLAGLPLTTTFCRGVGHHYFLNGLKTGRPWANLGMQQLQPAFRGDECERCSGPKWGGGSARGQDTPHMDMYLEEAYTGGSCLKLEADISLDNFVNFKLFPLAIDLKQYSAVYVTFTYKVIQDPDCDLYLKLDLQHGDRSIVLVLVPFDVGEYLVPTYSGNTSSFTVPSLNKSDIPGCLQNGYHGNMNRWKTRWFKIHDLYRKFCELKLVSVGLTTSDPQAKRCVALLGDLGIVPIENIPHQYPSVELTSAVYDRSPPVQLIDECSNKFDFNTEECKEGGDNHVETAVTRGDNQTTGDDSAEIVNSGSHVESVAVEGNNHVGTVTVKGDNTDKHYDKQDKGDDLEKSQLKEDSALGQGSISVGGGGCLKVPYDQLDKSRVYYQVVQCSQEHTSNSSDGKTIEKHAACLDCFTIQWSVANPCDIQYYRLFHVQSDYHAAILGHTIQPFYKITSFDIPYSAKDEVIQHLRFIIQPVMRNGSAVPFNDLEIFELACNKDGIKFVHDNYTTMGSDMRRDVKLSVHAGDRTRIKSPASAGGNVTSETKMSPNGHMTAKRLSSTMTDKGQMTDLGHMVGKGQSKGQTQPNREPNVKSPVKVTPSSSEDNEPADGHTERKRHSDNMVEVVDSTENIHIDETADIPQNEKTE